ncbi:alpha/beta fold hydrolase [Caulobacter sp. FWC2]|uniref:alpha/beta fold hydrolase n=1 Tax=Caulobacter sp. FWC2 TaxID=69664 RepID=UPI000C154FBD|nr:hypothetical protein [Caulobacter sp. FWC2]PIB91018.1 hypothetical protein CSW62_05195 [Caulobacter sp. FWC2]
MSADHREFEGVRAVVTAGTKGAGRATVRIAPAEHDAFILPTHAAWIARAIPGAELEVLAGCGHFAPWQAPAAFNRSVLSLLETHGRR